MGKWEYPTEDFSADERKLLEPFFTNLDRPVFALTNLPETTKAALFARYSRYQGTLRRLFLEEFAEAVAERQATRAADAGHERAAALMERVFVGYGDDSVAQLGGAHVACEWCSNLLTKVLQRHRIAAYLEQSTRYIPYDQPTSLGRYRFFYSPELGDDYLHDMEALFEAYRQALERVGAWVEDRYPRPDDVSEAAHRRALRAKTLDICRGLLPAASLSHVGIYASGQTYEQLIMHLLAHPLPEARFYGRAILAELQKVMPSFVARIERPDRGGRWIAYLQQREQTARRIASRLGIEQQAQQCGPSVRLLEHRGDESRLLAALLFEATGAPEQQTLEQVRRLGEGERAELLAQLAGQRENRRHRPGRGLEALSYRFEIVSDYGAFRDLQRHRLLTCQWQPLSPSLGAEIPPEAEQAGAGKLFCQALERSERAYRRLCERGLADQAPYALCLAYRIRFILDLNAREAMHLIELRSGREGHPSYRAIAHELHRQISRVHPAVGQMMRHVDLTTEPRLERLLAEIRNEQRRSAGRTP